MADCYKEQDRYFFSAALTADAFDFLTNRFDEHSLDASEDEQVVKRAKLEGFKQVFFSLVATSIGNMKRAIRGEIENNDIAISIHKLIGVDKETNECCVSSTPIVLKETRELGLVAQHSSLVLKIDCFTDDQLENMRKWIANDEVSMALADAHVDAGLQPEAKAVVPELLDALVLSPEGFALGENTSDFQDREAILKVLEEHAFIEKKTGEGLRTLWHLTEPGKHCIDVGISLKPGGKVTCTRSGIPINDMMMFELLNELEQSGWSLRVSTSRREKKRAQERPYKNEERKCWWVQSPCYVRVQH